MLRSVADHFSPLSFLATEGERCESPDQEQRGQRNRTRQDMLTTVAPNGFELSLLDPARFSRLSHSPGPAF